MTTIQLTENDGNPLNIVLAEPDVVQIVLGEGVASGGGGGSGTPGADGKTVRSGSGAPSAGLGVDGDFYIDTAANTIYGPKTSGSWGSPTSLVGPPGVSYGTDGLQISTAPSYQWYWTSTSNPTTRPGGSALVAGDQILVPIGAAYPGLWQWNGTYWLEVCQPTRIVLRSFSLSGLTNSPVFIGVPKVTAAGNIWIGQIRLFVLMGGTFNGSNRFDLQLLKHGSNTTITTISLPASTSPNNQLFTTSLDSLVAMGTDRLSWAAINTAGSPTVSDGTLQWDIDIRSIRP